MRSQGGIQDFVEISAQLVDVDARNRVLPVNQCRRRRSSISQRSQLGDGLALTGHGHAFPTHHGVQNATAVVAQVPYAHLSHDGNATLPARKRPESRRGIADSVTFGYLQEQVRGHYGYEPADLVTIVDLVRWHRLNFADSVSGVLALADAAEGARRLSAKEGNPIRLVLKP